MTGAEDKKRKALIVSFYLPLRIILLQRVVSFLNLHIRFDQDVEIQSLAASMARNKNLIN